MSLGLYLHIPYCFSKCRYCDFYSAPGQRGVPPEYPDALLRELHPAGVLHCFSGSVEMARELLRRGWYLGFDGPITYKNAVKALDVIAACPTDRMLLETDSPYLSPVPNRGKRNDSRNLPYIAARIAEIKGMTTEEVAEVTLRNGKQLFGL